MIILYVLEGCPYCKNSLEVLKQYKIKHKSILVNYEDKEFYKKQNKMNTFPQIFMQMNENTFMKIGGNDNLIELIDNCENIKNSNVSIDSIYYMYNMLYSK